jgi:2'-5' RNA ligase
MYYIAIVCPPAIDEKVLSYKHWMRNQFGCTVALKSPAHITLVAPFWLEEIRELELFNSLNHLQSSISFIEIQLTNFAHFSNRVLFVHVEANEQLAVLQGEVETYFSNLFSLEIKKDNRPFHPHITIANRDLSPQAFVQAWQKFAKEDYTAVFTADKISLLKLNPGKWHVIHEKKLNH